MSMMSAQPLEIRMAHLEGAYEQVADRLNGIDRRLDSFEQKMESRFTQVDGRFAQIDQKFMWVIGLVVTSWVTTVLAVLLHH